MLHIFYIALPPFDKYPKNASIFLHQTVYFPCYIQAMPPAKITWYKNEQPLILDETRMTTLPSGALEIDSVTNLDEGAYHCIASNPEKYRQSDVGYLIINRNSGKLYFNYNRRNYWFYVFLSLFVFFFYVLLSILAVANHWSVRKVWWFTETSKHYLYFLYFTSSILILHMVMNEK